MTVFAINGIEGGIYDYDYDDGVIIIIVINDYDYDDGVIIIIVINDYDYDYDDDDDVNCHYNCHPPHHQHNTIIIIFSAFSSILSE